MNRLIAVICLVAVPGIGSAIPLTYEFTANGGLNGPLAGVTSAGYFTFDDGIIVPNDTVTAPGTLLDLSFTWNGVAYDETTANLGFLNFDVAGMLSVWSFGPNCAPGTCSIFGGTEGWYTYGFPGGGVFGYALDDELDIFFGSVSEAVLRSHAAVSEPGTLALLAAGLLALVWAIRRIPRDAAR